MFTWYLPGESRKLGPSPISHMASRDHSQLSQSEIAIFATHVFPLSPHGLTWMSP